MHMLLLSAAKLLPATSNFSLLRALGLTHEKFSIEPEPDEGLCLIVLEGYSARGGPPWRAGRGTGRDWHKSEEGQGWQPCCLLSAGGESI